MVASEIRQSAIRIARNDQSWLRHDLKNQKHRWQEDSCYYYGKFSQSSTEIKGSVFTVFKQVAIPLRSSSKMSRSKPPRLGTPVVHKQAGRSFHRSTCVPLVFSARNLRAWEHRSSATKRDACSIVAHASRLCSPPPTSAKGQGSAFPHHRSRANRGTSGRWALGADEQPEFESDARSGDQGAREERLKHNEGSGCHNREERDRLERSDNPERGATGGEHQKDDVV